MSDNSHGALEEPVRQRSLSKRLVAEGDDAATAPKKRGAAVIGARNQGFVNNKARPIAGRAVGFSSPLVAEPCREAEAVVVVAGEGVDVQVTRDSFGRVVDSNGSRKLRERSIKRVVGRHILEAAVIDRSPGLPIRFINRPCRHCERRWCDVGQQIVDAYPESSACTLAGRLLKAHDTSGY